MIYDTHCHPYLAKEKSQDEILENFFRNSSNKMNSIACDIDSSITSINLAKKYSGIYATIGIHPTHCFDYKGKEQEVIQELKDLYNKNRDYIVAIGETGLDYYWIDSLSEKYNLKREEALEIQKTFFTLQIQLAKQLELPLIIHNRSSSEDVLSILIEQNFTNFVFHCYSEDISYANRLIQHAPDCVLGFGGVVTFKNAEKTQLAAKNIPLKNIIIETDSPYLTPVPYRGKQENEPIYCENVLSKIIDLREETPTKIREEIYKNSLDFFNIS